MHTHIHPYTHMPTHMYPHAHIHMGPWFLCFSLEESANPGAESLGCWKFTLHLDKLGDSHSLAFQLHRGLMVGGL